MSTDFSEMKPIEAIFDKYSHSAIEFVQICSGSRFDCILFLVRETISSSSGFDEDTITNSLGIFAEACCNLKQMKIKLIESVMEVGRR